MKNNLPIIVLGAIVIFVAGAWFLKPNKLEDSDNSTNLITRVREASYTPTPGYKVEGNSDIDVQFQKLDKNMKDAQSLDNDTDLTTGL